MPTHYEGIHHIMPLDEDEMFEDDEIDERSIWQIDAERAVDNVWREADFDDVRGVIAIPGDDLEHKRWVEYRDIKGLIHRLTDVYDMAWYVGVPFASGEALFKGDAYGYVGDLLADREVEDFYNAIHDPEDADEIITSRELVDDIEKSRVLRIDLQEISGELIRYLARHPHLMRNLDPRKFEELVAELLRDKGYDVELTPCTRDGGFDIIAIQKGDLGSALTIVECKRFAESRKVDVGIVRGLYGVVEEKRATQGLIATTSYFTKDAIAFRDRTQYRLSLADFDSLTKFLRQWKTR